MSMTEPTIAAEIIPAAKKPKRASKPRRKAAAPAAAPKQSVCAGITVSDCPTACTATKCVISGVGICSHPHKGGLQAGLQNPDNMRRLNEAKRIIGKAKLDLMGGT